MATPTSHKQRIYLAESLDPIHIGTGEFRLGRVDNTIVREAGTNLPKIPGSSIGGVARAYTAMKTGNYLDGKQKSCAGKGGKAGEDHCGRPSCRVCTTYGFSKGQLSFQGLAQFGDARILFFPVYSITGPVWVTCPASLRDAGCRPRGGGASVWDSWNERLTGASAPSVYVASRRRPLPNPLNLGWLYLPQYSGGESLPDPREWEIGDGIRLPDVNYLPVLLDRLILVADGLFSTVIDDQLEVRTSVSISPATGAAESGALFTSEAIPRACFLFFPVTCLVPEFFRVPVKPGSPGEKVSYNGRDATIEDIHENVIEGLRMMEALGIGGVNTRGMGRLRVIPIGD